MRGFLFDRDAHAALIVELERQRSRSCRCLCAGVPTLAALTTPCRKRLDSVAHCLRVLLNSAELAAWKRTPKSQELSTKRVDLKKAKHYPPLAVLIELVDPRQGDQCFRRELRRERKPGHRAHSRQLRNMRHRVRARVLFKAKFAADAETHGVPRPVRRGPRLCPGRRGLCPDGDARQCAHHW